MFDRIKEILKLALPAVGEMILYMLIWVCDTIMVGKYAGNTGVSAVGLSSEIIYTFFNILVAMGLSVGVTSIISRALGGKNLEKAKDIGNIAIKLAFILGLILSVLVFIFSKNILRIAGAEEKIIGLASGYIRICSIGITFNMITNVMNGIFRGSKNTKTPLYSAFIANVVNIFLDYSLIFGKFGFPELGVMGAGVATTTAIICAFLFIISQRKKLPFEINPLLRNKKENFKELVFLSVPSGCQEGAFSINRLINVSIIMGLGSIAFASNQITITIESMSFMPGWGLSVALTSLVGHSFGEKNLKKAKEYITCTIVLAVICMGIMSIIFFVFPKELISLFIKKDEIEVIKWGTICLMLAGIEQIPMAIAMVLEGAMKGMGDTKTPFKVVLITNWLVRMPLMYYFLVLNHHPVTTFWKITAFQWTVEAIIIFFVFEYKWKKYYTKMDI